MPQAALIRTAAEECGVFIVPPSGTLNDGSCDDALSDWNELKREYMVSDAQLVDVFKSFDDGDSFLYMMRICGKILNP